MSTIALSSPPEEADEHGLIKGNEPIGYGVDCVYVQAIDGRPHFAKLSIDDGKQEEIAAIDPDFEWSIAPVPDGMS